MQFLVALYNRFLKFELLLNAYTLFYFVNTIKTNFVTILVIIVIIYLLDLILIRSTLKARKCE